MQYMNTMILNDSVVDSLSWRNICFIYGTANLAEEKKRNHLEYLRYVDSLTT